MQVGYLRDEGLVPICRESTLAKMSGLNRREKRRVGALIARRNWLAVKLQDMPRERWHYDGQELSALEWAIEIIQEHYDLINTIED